MILTDQDREALGHMDDHALVEVWQCYADAEAGNRAGREYVEYLLTGRMDDRGADAMPSTTHEVKLERRYDYDDGKLAALREIVDPELVATAWTPPHQVWSPEKWDMRTVRGWHKFGGEIAATIDGATLPRPAKIRIKPRRDDATR